VGCALLLVGLPAYAVSRHHLTVRASRHRPPQMPLSDVCLDPARPWISNVELHLRPADPAQFQRDLDGFLHAIAFGASFVDSGTESLKLPLMPLVSLILSHPDHVFRLCFDVGFHYKNPFLRTWMMGYGMVYYGINSDAARSRGELVYARGNVKLQKMLWNLPDSSMIRYRIMLQQCTLH